MSDDGAIKASVDKELGEDDMRKLLGSNTKIITYPNLAGKSIEDVFDANGNCVILFLTENQNTGHWIGLIRHSPDAIEFFDSFGKKPDGDMSWLSKQEQVSLGETHPLITEMLSGFGGRVVHNTTKLQKDSSSTCGRHVACRMRNKSVPLSDYVNRLKATGDPDRAVTDLTAKVLGH